MSIMCQQTRRLFSIVVLVIVSVGVHAVPVKRHHSPLADLREIAATRQQLHYHHPTQHALRQHAGDGTYETPDFLQDGEIRHETGCPCSNVSLCDPITTTPKVEIFGFLAQSWKNFDWDLVTTVAWPEMQPDQVGLQLGLLSN
jgi:hypothetical protein